MALLSGQCGEERAGLGGWFPVSTELCGASPPPPAAPPLQRSDDVAISASDHSLGLGAAGGECMTDVTLVPIRAAGGRLGSAGLSGAEAEGDEEVATSVSAEESWSSSSSESLSRGSESLAAALSSLKPSLGCCSFWSEEPHTEHQSQTPTGTESNQNDAKNKFKLNLLFF